MLGKINDAFNAKKAAAANDRFIAEAAMDVEEILPGSDEEMEDLVDTDSVPDEVYRKVDAALEKLISDEKYDDTEVEELIDDDDVDDSENPEIDAIITDAADEME